MQTIRIFISSPNDVAEERAKARQVIETLQRPYASLATLEVVMWEDLALSVDCPAQESIARLLSEQQGVHIAVFILWSRLGSPLSEKATPRPGGGFYRSGTEHEFELMLAARQASGGKKPHIMAYWRQDEKSFIENLKHESPADYQKLLEQRELARQFIEERFMDEQGRNIRGLHMFAEPVSFAQRLDRHLRQVLDEVLATDQAAPSWTESPYRSLEVFDIRHAPIFYGRDEETCDLLQRLRDQERAGCAFACIVGASGSGKSSLARAGVAATLMQRSFDDGVKEWRAAVFLPSLASGDLFLALAQSLAGHLPELSEGIGGIEDFATCLRDQNFKAASILLQTAFNQASRDSANVPETRNQEPGTRNQKTSLRLLLVLDQMEELWTDPSITPESREKFLQAIEALARSARLSVLATLRSDFYPQAQLSDAFLRMKGERGHFDLTSPGTAALQELIVQPAHRAGLRFQRDERTGRTLDQRILEDAARDPSALPLLQYALAELHEHRDAQQRLLTFAAYEKMGGVEGALGQRAGQTFDALSDDARAALDEVLPPLVSVDIAGEQNAVRRRAPLADLADLATSSPRAILTKALIAARFLTTDEDKQSGAPIVTLAHEALLRRWDRLKEWIDRNRHLLRLRATVEQSQQRWEQSGQNPSLLLPPGLPLEEGRRLLRDGDHILGAATAGFIRDSVAYHEDQALRRARLKRMVITALSLLSVVAMAGGIYAFLSAREAAQQRDEARYNEGLGWMLRAQVAEERKNQYPDTLLYAAQAIGFDGVGRPADAPAALLRFIRQDRNPDTYAAARKWISERPAYLPVWASALRPAPRSDGFQPSLSLSPEGRRLALGSADGSVHLWDFLDGKETVVIPPGGDAVGDVAFQPSGKLLAIAAGKSIRLWDIEKAAFTVEYDRAATRLAWSPGGTILGAAAADGSIHLWRDGKLTAIQTGQKKPAASLSFSADNSALATAFPGSGVRLVFPHVAEVAGAWSQLDARNAGTLEEEKRAQFLALAKLISTSSAVAMRPDGLVLAVGGSDGTLSVWDAAGATLIGQASLEQRHHGGVLSLAFRQDGLQIASASEDGSIRLWEISGENVPVVTATLTGHRGAVTSVQYAPGGDILASAGADGSARLWNVSGNKASAPDLYTYIDQRWYGFDPAAQQTLTWADGTGFANVPADSIAGIWQAGGAQAFARLMSAREWTGAAAVRPAGGQQDLATALLADARDAAKSNRWNRVDLRLGQLQALGATEGTADLQRQRSAFAPQEGQPFTNPTGISLLWCPAGSFTMGSPKEEPGRYSYETQHKVTLGHGFWLSQYELTQAQWIAVMGNNPSTQKEAGLKAPVENVSWDEAVDFCRRLTDRERARGTIPPGWEYALPTEAQWEYACRAGTGTAYSFGDDTTELHRYGNFNDKTGNFSPDPDRTQDDKSRYTAPVGRYLPNPWKFHDMHGNVYEWCMDSMDPAKPAYSSADAMDPLGKQGTHRVDRGGGWINSARDCRSASRHANPPSSRRSTLGFRPALVPSRPVGAVAPEKASGSEPGTKR